MRDTTSETVNRISVKETLATDTLPVSDLLSKLISVDAGVQVGALSAVQASQDPALWAHLLTLMAEGLWGAGTEPELPAGSPDQHRLTLKLYALFAHDPVPATAPVKEEILLAGLQHPHSAVRRTAAELLGVRHSSRAVSALVAILQQDHNREVRCQAAHALGQIADPAAIDPLVAALASRDGWLRQSARQALVAIGRPVMPPLIEALADPHDHVRWEAAKALGEIGDPAAAPALVQALEDENSGVRWLAAEGLITLGRAGLAPLLQALMQHSDSVWLREGAHHVLYHLALEGLDEVASPVLAALEDIAPAVEVPLAALASLDVLSGARHLDDQRNRRN